MDQQGIVSHKGPEGAKFARNVLGVFTTELLIALLSFCTSVITARLLDPKDQGMLSLAMAVPITLTFISNLGLAQANIYFIGRKRGPLVDITANSFTVALSIGLVTIVAICLLRDIALEAVFGGLDSASLMLVTCVVPLMLVDRYLLSILEGFSQFGLFNLRRLLTPLLLFMGMLFSLRMVGAGLSGAILTYVIIISATTIGFVLALGRMIPLKFGFNVTLLKDSLFYGVKSYFQSLIMHLLYQGDLYLVAIFLASDQVAYYVVATSLAKIAFYIPDSVGLVIFPSLSSMESEDAHRFTAVACRQTFFVTVFIAVALCMTSGILIPFLYGWNYAPAVSPLIVLLPGVAIVTVYKVLVRNFTSRNKLYLPIITAAAGLALNVWLNLVLIPRYGIVGAAISSTMAYSVSAVALLGAFLRDSGASLCETVFVQRSDLAMYANVLRRLWLSLRAWKRGSLPFS